ncbi:response regulator transcription factor [Amycolatopsis benzoatilytica]|uniref:response regulator transcription factor n=1 Tax=Amycolatopsis benzoatilytica TaxID=346045 RepID=UPI00037925D0|nr:response regulator transcription factor [Amycolatopsis benzoatilytica]
MLNGQGDFEVVGQCGAVQEALGALPDADGVVAVVSELGDDFATFRRLGARVKVITFAEIGSDFRPVDIVTLNARAVLPPTTTPDELVHAIRVVAAGDIVLMPVEVHRQVSTLMQDSDTARRGGADLQLTSRERDVLELLAHGLSNADIALRLSVSAATVRSHVHHILQKFAVPSRAQAVIAAYGAGVVALATRETERLPELA